MKYFFLISIILLTGFGCGSSWENVVDDTADEATVSDEVSDDEALLDSETSPQDKAGMNDPMVAYDERIGDYENTEVNGMLSVLIENMYEGLVDQANVWIFTIPDDEGRVILSTEKNQSIYMAELDVENPDARPDWKLIVSGDEIGEGIADHWHVFSRGYHYLVFSVSGADGAYVMKVDKDLNRVGLEKIVDEYELSEGDGAQFKNSPNGEAYLITNDMFLVEDAGGVAAAFFLPGYGHKLFRIDADLNVYDIFNIGGGAYAHGNGSSAIRVDDGVHVLAADTIAHVMEGGVRLFQYDNDWNLLKVDDLVHFDETAIGMVSGAYFDDGSLVLHARVNRNAYAPGDVPAVGGGTQDDGGDIARYIFDTDLNLASIEYLFEGPNAHRPHTNLLENTLFTGWDTVGSTTLRIDEITY